VCVCVCVVFECTSYHTSADMLSGVMCVCVRERDRVRERERERERVHFNVCMW